MSELTRKSDGIQATFRDLLDAELAKRYESEHMLSEYGRRTAGDFRKAFEGGAKWAMEQKGLPQSEIGPERYSELVRKVYDSDTRPIKVRWGDSYWFSLVNAVLDELGVTVRE